MSRNTQSVSQNTDLRGVTKMTVDILLPRVGIGFRGVRHTAVGKTVWVEIGVLLGKFLCFFQNRVEKFRIVFSDRQLNSRCVVYQVIRFFLVYLSADRFGEVDELLEHIGKVFAILRFETAELRTARNLVKVAEITEFTTEFQESNK